MNKGVQQQQQQQQLRRGKKDYKIVKTIAIANKNESKTMRRVSEIDRACESCKCVHVEIQYQPK